ncbi:uncharacterized protein SPPG_00523 [Spizellomyces punctatus DAOM BR117]|uniref:BZIP domain-containing protein n=1 Tax=Spizellomyces punctatus (strain DAOM BR117) TaxID=645134 RepID=A0A0L0HV96_SPIPD|nr:uncharacterized protein SPPG_00523 [Spizellomyces punctatus DAOM BR117]KND04820.1 hypothetical protein SPPG_00523 [Spizellomyces punctatus DAOM BR117]|eukprot:XP_016612859.1 hypothetical protein SPPG_00523 [Spizellomyces punctatus DAOM BR117]
MSPAMTEATIFDFDQLLGGTPIVPGLSTASPQSTDSPEFDGRDLFGDLPSSCSPTNDWLLDDQALDQLLAESASSTPLVGSPASTGLEDMPLADLFGDEKLFMDLPVQQPVAICPSPIPSAPVSPASTVDVSSPEFALSGMFESNQGWAVPNNAGNDLFPKLTPTWEQGRTAAVKPPVPAKGIEPVKPLAAKPVVSASPQAPAIAPLSAALLPLLGNIGQVAATLAVNPSGLAAAAAAGVQVQQLQQHLQALAAMQSRQTPTVVKASVDLTPPYTVGRKRKERSSDPSEIIAEMDMKRQKNTEAARRSRARKLERMADLESQVKVLEQERDDLKAKVVDLESTKDRYAAREVEYLAQIIQLQQRLKVYEA